MTEPPPPKRARPPPAALPPPPPPSPQQPSLSAVAPPPLALADFDGYVNFRILDSLGHPGVYRKFLFKRRDHGVEWATTMCSRVANVQAGLKALAALEQDLKGSHALHSLHLVWQHVIESNTPPSDLQLTIATCAITNKPNTPCVVIRSKGRGATNFTVSSKFAPFLYHLWITYKLDILIKVYARRCMEQLDPAGARPLADIVQDIKGRAGEVASLARSLHVAYTHVTRSALGGLLAVV